VLSDAEGVLPRAGRRIETTVHLDELTAHGFCKLASGDAGGRRLSAGDVAVVVRGYVHRSFHDAPFQVVLLY